MRPRTSASREPGGMNPDRLAELEDERRYLLRSLRDLDVERAAGDVDAIDYATLHDGYTKRAADVLRDIEEGKAALPSRRSGAWRRRTLIVAAVIVVAAAAGWLVASASGQRTGDQTITGGVEQDDVAVLLAQARALIGVDPAGAQELYQRILDERPEDPEAMAYSAWLLYVASDGAGAELRAAAVSTAEQQLQRAVAADPTYPDPHCFLAVIAAGDGAAGAGADVDTARAEIERCRALDPPAEVRAIVDRFAAGLDATPTTTAAGAGGASTIASSVPGG